MMRIEFVNTIGRHLSTRLEGKAVREQIQAMIEQKQQVVFDFHDVEIISNSFADECFAKLMLDFELPTVKEHTTFQNASPFVKAVIANSFKERLHMLHSA